MALPKKPESDFDADKLLEAQDQHGKNISDLTGRILKIEGHLLTPQALAAFFEASAKDSRNLDGVFAKMFCRFMDESQDVKDAVKKRMEEIDRNFFHKTFKRLWFPIYSGFLVVITLIGKQLVEWLLTLIPHK